ncbi:hypothetical protein [Chitinophaga tropicalis]|uniref:Lipoprotein n=1 Tax=Chitinophaga tropicalis TaxID=2683588 RepID=A0A7K1U7R5_9BACT|nr:hypothetical protein [Chitinophaga tropicalis]MVT10390.1 hypothetical protein [Chitinophaga tropicalis]
MENLKGSKFLIEKLSIQLLILMTVFTSCDYKLLVHKDRVFNTRTGYLLFHNRQKYFFPSKHITGNDFFTARLKEPGYLISFDKEEDLLYQIGEKYVIDYEYQDKSMKVFVRDSMVILPVIIGSIPYKEKSGRGKGELVIKFNNKIKILDYYTTNNESVWSVYPVLKQDIEESSKFYN